MWINRHLSGPVAVALLATSLTPVVLGGCAGRPGTRPSAGPVPSALATTPATTTATGTPSAPSAGPTGTAGPSVTPPAPGPGPTGTAPFPAALAGQDIERIPGAGAVIALTFDAGANADGVPSIVDTLGREGVPATFFLTGEFVGAFPAQARQITAAGYRLGNHSVDHPHFPALSDAALRAEVRDAATQIRAVTGADPAPLFRFPFGDRDARVIAALNALGYLPVRWSVDSLGWQGTLAGARDATFTANRVLAAATAGGIVLMHVGSNPDDHSTLDADALPAIIAGLRARGYRLVSLDALLAG